MRNKIGLLCVVLGIVYNVSVAQTKDYGLWTTLGLEKKYKKWDFAFESELRTKSGLSELNRWSLQLEPSYHIIKPIQLGLGYQFINFNDTKYSDWQPRHKAYTFVQGKLQLHRFTFSLRQQLQVTRKDDSDRIKKSGKINYYKINPDWEWRCRIKMAYDIPKISLKPSVAVESFYQLNNPDGNSFDGLRYTLSFDYSFAKQHHFELYGLIDKEINQTNPVTMYVVGVGYAFVFSKK